MADRPFQIRWGQSGRFAGQLIINTSENPHVSDFIAHKRNGSRLCEFKIISFIEYIQQIGKENIIVALPVQ